jgi:SAM-dependent methyltransferase
LHSSELKKHFQSIQGVSEKATAYLHSYKLVVIKQIIKYLKEFKPGKLLDIGSSCGMLLNEARGLGWEAYGVEISLPNAEYSHRKYGLNVFNGYLHDAKFRDKSFKMVTIIDTLYYCYRPVQELKEICRILEDDGLLFVRVANRINYIRAWQTVRMLLGICCHLSRNIFFEGMNDHLYFFDTGSLRKTLDASGFRDIRFFNGAMAYKVKEGLFINNVRRAVVQLLNMAWWLSGGRMCFAPSIIAIARK